MELKKLTADLKCSMQGFKQLIDRVCTEHRIEVPDQPSQTDTAPSAAMIFENDTVGMI